MTLKAVRTHDHDQKVKLEQVEILCYSKKQLDKIHPDGNYKIVGETKAKNKKKAVAEFEADDKIFKVSRHGKNNRILNKEAGYVKVGDTEYIALLKSRIPFLLILFGLLLILALLLKTWMIGPSQPVINPDHPLPDQDQHAVQIDPNAPLEDEHEDAPPADNEDGGGSVSMIYTLEADVSLSSGAITMYFKNPSNSTHDVVLEAYIKSDGVEYLVGKSGRLPAGYELTTMTLIPDYAVLSEGMYDGLYKVQCYNPQTGELALVAPQITDLTFTVRQ